MEATGRELDEAGPVPDSTLRAAVVSGGDGRPVLRPTDRVPVSAGDGNFHYLVEHGLEAFKNAGTVIVPGYAGTSRRPSPAVVTALQDAAARGIRIASACTGAFAVAAVGLLDGRRATTHWSMTDQLTDRYPGVRVDRNVLFVDEGQIVTSTGVAAGIDPCLHIIRRDHGVRLVAEVARHVVAAPYRDGGQAQFVPRTLPEDSRTVLARIRAWVLDQLDNPLTVRDMAEHPHTSYRPSPGGSPRTPACHRCSDCCVPGWRSAPGSGRRRSSGCISPARGDHAHRLPTDLR